MIYNLYLNLLDNTLTYSYLGKEKHKHTKIIEYFQYNIHKSNFFQTINEFLYLNSKCVRFFRTGKIKENVLLSILRIIYLAIIDNYHNLNLFSNVSAKNFVNTFSCLGSYYSNFVIYLSKMFFSDKYYYSNYFFIKDIYRYTLNLETSKPKRNIFEPININDDELEKNLIMEGMTMDPTNANITNTYVYELEKKDTLEEVDLKELRKQWTKVDLVEKKNNIYKYMDLYCNSQKHVINNLVNIRDII